jgi:hypothetical protein
MTNSTRRYPMASSLARGTTPAIVALIATAAIAAAACGATGSTSGASPAGAQTSVGASVGATAVASNPAASSADGDGSVVNGTFASGRTQLTLTGAAGGLIDMPNLTPAFGAPGTTGTGPGYKWYAEGDKGAAVSIRFPSDPVSNGTTSGLPNGTGIQVEFDLLATAGDLFSSSTGECTVSFDENTAAALRGRLDCHGVAGSQDKAKTIDATGTFEATP